MHPWFHEPASVPQRNADEKTAIPTQLIDLKEKDNSDEYPAWLTDRRRMVYPPGSDPGRRQTAVASTVSGVSAGSVRVIVHPMKPKIMVTMGDIQQKKLNGR